MRSSRPFFFFLLFLLGTAVRMPLQAQLGYKLDIEKPKPFEERDLKAEKTGEKKFGIHRRFFQNLTTHYNYFFNASNKLNEVVARAKQAHKDDYTSLLPFYNYNLDFTATESTQLDSVIYKAKTGVVMHDLRNDWIDDLYLLWGASFFLQKKFDSAFQMFQFINWAFAEKQEDGYYKYIGSRMDGNTALTISTKEDDGFFKRMIADPPSRNHALIWLARTFIETKEMDAAGSLIVTLRNDPLFPERLRSTLNEVQAYWYYKQGMWDSSAAYLVQALDRATNKMERSRWEYLAAQMFEKSRQQEAAQEWYARAINHTTDPVLDIYARLNMVRINKSGGENYIEENIAELLKMARRDKYADYRDVIYFMAAQMELERNDPDAARELLLKGAKYASGNSPAKQKAYLLLADLSYTRKDYLQAARFYDSLTLENFPEEEFNRVAIRKTALGHLVPPLLAISRQDSLQRIAALPEEEREAIVKKMVRTLRKQQGLGDEDAAPTAGSGMAPAGADLFPAAAASAPKGEWYFYNDNLRTQGAATFRQVWGNRPNVDNWRRFADVTAQLQNTMPDNTRPDDGTGVPVTEASAETDHTPTFTNLMNRLPLTEEKMQASNDSIRASLFRSGVVYINEIEDYPAGIRALEELRSRFPDGPELPEVLFYLNYAYSKNGDAGAAEEVRNVLIGNHPDSRFAAIAKSGKDPEAVSATSESTRDYEEIYNMFIEGRFTEALQAKKRADSLYQTNYWQPQLLYIEAVYHIRERADSTALEVLQTLVNQSPNTPLAARADNLMQVLSRRREIEEELRALDIGRPQEEQPALVRITRPPAAQDTTTVRRSTPPTVPDTTAVAAAPPLQEEEPPAADRTARADNIGTDQKDKAVVTGPKGAVDSVGRRQVAPRIRGMYLHEPEKSHYAVIILNKVDRVFGNEARNAFTRFNKENYYNQTSLTAEIFDLDEDNRLLVVGPFENAQLAVNYVQKAKPLAPREIVPWLKADKYSFTVISAPNLEVLKENKDLGIYHKFLEQYLPGKF